MRIPGCLQCSWLGFVVRPIHYEASKCKPLAALPNQAKALMSQSLLSTAVGAIYCHCSFVMKTRAALQMPSAEFGKPGLHGAVVMMYESIGETSRCSFCEGNCEINMPPHASTFRASTVVMCLVTPVSAVKHGYATKRV